MAEQQGKAALRALLMGGVALTAMPLMAKDAEPAVATPLSVVAEEKASAADITQSADVSKFTLGEGELVQRFRLSNGMRVLVVPNPIVPAVSHMVWYDVGAADDPDGKSGLAHFFEHMMFRGTQDVPAGQFSQIVARVGGEDNAFTSQDYTAYYQRVAKKYLPMVMRLESDRMHNLLLNEEEIAREREVIIEERHQVIESNIERLFGEQLRNALFSHHPYQQPVIGWEHEMQTLNKDDLDTFYKAYYHPANAVLVVGGDITAEELKPLAEQYYGGITAGEPITRPEWKEPPHRAARRMTMQHKLAKQPMWRREYVAPSHRYGRTEDAFPLLVMSYVLGSDNTGMFYKELVEKRKLVTGVDVYYSGGYRGPGVFTVRFSPVPGAEIAQIETLIDSMLADVLAKGVDEDDVARSKRLLKAMTIYSREGIATMANFVGMLEVTGIGLDYLREWEEQIDAVTVAAMQEAAGHTLKPERSVTGVLLPEDVAQEGADEN